MSLEVKADRLYLVLCRWLSEPFMSRYFGQELTTSERLGERAIRGLSGGCVRRKPLRTRKAVDAVTVRRQAAGWNFSPRPRVPPEMLTWDLSLLRPAGRRRSTGTLPDEAVELTTDSDLREHLEAELNRLQRETGSLTHSGPSRRDKVL